MMRKKRRNRAGEKLAFLRQRLLEYRAAESRILLAQSYGMGSRTLTRADLKEVRDTIESLETRIEQLEETGSTKRRVARGIPVD